MLVDKNCSIIFFSYVVDRDVSTTEKNNKSGAVTEKIKRRKQTKMLTENCHFKTSRLVVVFFFANKNCYAKNNSCNTAKNF